MVSNSRPGDRRPEGGSPMRTPKSSLVRLGRATAKTNCSISASTKIGMETPRMAPNIVVTSVLELRRSAEMRPSRMPTHGGEEQRVDGQLDGRGQALDEDLRHRPAVADGFAEVAAEQLPDVEDELDVDGLVEAVALVEGVADGIGGALAERRQAGVAGQQSGDDEDDGDDADQRGDAEEHPPDDVLGHPTPLRGSPGAATVPGGRGRGAPPCSAAPLSVMDRGRGYSSAGGGGFRKPPQRAAK